MGSGLHKFLVYLAQICAPSEPLSTNSIPLAGFMTSLMKRELCRTTNDNNFTALSSFVSGITSLLFDKKKNAYPIMLKFMFNKFNAP